MLKWTLSRPIQYLLHKRVKFIIDFEIVVYIWSSWTHLVIQDLVARLEPVMMELERQGNVLLVGHQAGGIFCNRKKNWCFEQEIAE